MTKCQWAFGSLLCIGSVLGQTQPDVAQNLVLTAYDARSVAIPPNTVAAIPGFVRHQPTHQPHYEIGKHPILLLRYGSENVRLYA